MKKDPQQLSLASLSQKRIKVQAPSTHAAEASARKPTSLARVKFERARDLLIEELDRSGIFPRKKA